MTALLDKGADPNARLKKKVWYSGYNFDLSGVDEIGATPFWRAAYASDVDAMKLLVAHGADPNIPTDEAGRPAAHRRRRARGARTSRDCRRCRSAVPACRRSQAAAGVGYGEGFAANSHRFAPTGMLAAVKYLVEELGADVNAVDHEGNTALHHAAARGDNEMIQYLVSKGADVEGRQSRGQDDGGHGQRPGAAHPAVSRDASRCSRSWARRTTTSACPAERYSARSAGSGRRSAPLPHRSAWLCTRI